MDPSSCGSVYSRQADGSWCCDRPVDWSDMGRSKTFKKFQAKLARYELRPLGKQASGGLVIGCDSWGKNCGFSRASARWIWEPLPLDGTFATKCQTGATSHLLSKGFSRLVPHALITLFSKGAGGAQKGLIIEATETNEGLSC